jgi:hypothetical protein
MFTCDEEFTLMTCENLAAALVVMGAVADAIRELGRVPAGHLYAVLSGRMSLTTFEALVGRLLDAGLIRREGFELVWCGE